MRVALLQYPIAWADKETNLHLAEERIAALAGKADVAVLPEMFATGFCTDHPELAETMEGDIIRRLQATADQSGVAIVSSFICKPAIGQRLVNRGFMITPNSVYPNREELEGDPNLPSLQGGDGGRLPSVILSTHILQEVREMCDRVIILDHGTVKADLLIDQIDNLEQLFHEKTQN